MSWTAHARTSMHPPHLRFGKKWKDWLLPAGDSEQGNVEILAFAQVGRWS